MELIRKNLIERHRTLSVNEFCQSFGVGRSTAFAEIKEGRLRARKCGKRILISENDAEDWLRRLPTITSSSNPEVT